MSESESINLKPMDDHSDEEAASFYKIVHRATNDFIRNPENIRLLATTLWGMREGDPDTARFLLYEFVMDYRYHENLQTITEQLAHRQILWEHPNLKQVRQHFYEQDNFIENPPMIDEGVIECIRCRSKRTFSFSKQTRRGDESTTVFVRCSECSKTFRI